MYQVSCNQEMLYCVLHLFCGTQVILNPSVNHPQTLIKDIQAHVVEVAEHTKVYWLRIQTAKDTPVVNRSPLPPCEFAFIPDSQVNCKRQMLCTPQITQKCFDEL